MKKLRTLMAIGLIGALSLVPFISQAETVTVVQNSNSGIENAYYSATLADGTVLGFYLYSSKAYFCGAKSQKASLNVPDSVIYSTSYSTSRYPVTNIGYNRLDFDNAQSVTSLTLPSTITSLYYMAPTVKTLHLKNYISNFNTDFLANLSRVLVPASTLSSYFGNSNWYDYVLINEEGAEPSKITINMTKPGEFAQQLLEKTGNDWMKVNELIVTGELNADDLGVFNRMRQLTSLDLSGATITAIPNRFSYNNNSYRGFGILETLKLPTLNTIGNYAFQYCYKLSNVTMPGVTTIGECAFHNCTKLQEITLPEEVKTINSNAFSYSGLKSVAIPNSITAISSYCFSNCSSLESITLPPSVTTIGYEAFYNTALKSISLPGVKTIDGEAFYNCKQLEKVEFAEGLTTLEYECFQNCIALTSVDLPASLLVMGSYPFYGCSGIKKVVSRAVTSPYYYDSSAIIYGCDMTNVKLYVPAMSIDSYRAKNGWKSFYTILPIEEKLTNVLIFDDATIDNPSQFAEGCNFKISTYYDNYYYDLNRKGTVDYNGASTLSMGNYEQYHYMGTSGSSGYNRYSYNSRHTALIANGPMRTNTVKTELQIPSTSIWYFISLPYDVKVSDITYTDDTQFVIRRYSGLNRAQTQSNTWQNLTADSIMRAYEGYILKCNKQNAIFTFPAINNANKNKVFESGNVVMPLGEFLSEYAHNRSWNLIGNPYPCYYDTRFMDFTAPITVWNRYNSRYDAYSPVDDSFILHPAQAFFVQRPLDQASITFDKEGRQKTETVRTINSMVKRVSADRQLYNVYLSSGENDDHARFVFNDGAARSYELDKDASKLIADGNTSVLLYTVEDGVKYAINERDYADGIINLGFYAPVDGEYRLSLDTNSTESITLIDKESGIQTALLGEYMFKAKAGYHDGRIALQFGQSGVREHSNDNVMINVNGGSVSANVPCQVYTIDGRLVGTCDADSAITLDKGVYVISGNNVTRKIIVK